MDAETQQKIEELATRLKQNFLAASMDEARKRATEIILSSIETPISRDKD